VLEQALLEHSPICFKQLFISSVSKYIPLGAPGNTKFFLVHIPSIAIDYSLSVLFIMICKVLILSMLFMSFYFYMQSRPCPPSNSNSAFFTWFSHLHLIFYARLLKYLSSMAFLAGSTTLSAASSLKCGHILLRSSSLHRCVAGFFSNK
jgi:hypothetical protein